MTALSLRLPESLHRRLAEVSAREGISINQFITTAVAEKMSALMTEEYISARAARASRAKFESALSRVAERPPDENDRIIATDPSRPKRR